MSLIDSWSGRLLTFGLLLAAALAILACGTSATPTPEPTPTPTPTPTPAPTSTPTPVPEGAGPTRDELYGAVKAVVDGENQRLEELAGSCQRREFENNPVMAMQCLALGFGSGGTFEFSFELLSAEKIACAEAVGQPGFICDYILNFRMNAPPEVQSSFESIIGQSGSLTQARFVRTQAGWVLLPHY